MPLLLALAASAAMSVPKLPEAVDALASKLTREDKFSGVVLLAKGGSLLLAKAYGYADKRFMVRNKLDTSFNIASMTKMLTGVTVAQLVQQGKLKFTDRVGELLPEERSGPYGDVTIHQLLTHTSGMGSYWKPEFFTSDHAQYRTLQDYRKLLGTDPLQFEPGSKWSYSNAGYLMLGLVVEKVSGSSYYDYVAANVLKPAGMSRSGFFDLDRPITNMATGYTKQNRYFRGLDVWTETTFVGPAKGSSAGGCYASAPDLLKFALALQRGKLLKQDLAQAVQLGRIEYVKDRKYGYGFANEWINGIRIVFHDGGAEGISAQLDIYPNSGYVAIVLSNYDHPAAAPLVKLMRTELTKENGK